MKRFTDRAEAGRMLADRIEHPNSATVVLALPRGGVPVAFEIAARLRAPLDVLVVRKLGVPWQPELAMGAIAGDSFQVLDQKMIAQLGIEPIELDRVIAQERAEAKRQERIFRQGRPAPHLRSSSVILVDDGLATGSTMQAAIECVRSFHPARITVAVPVGSKEACARLANEVDGLLCLSTPVPFRAVGEWYENFRQVSDDEVEQLLAANQRQFSTAK